MELVRFSTADGYCVRSTVEARLHNEIPKYVQPVIKYSFLSFGNGYHRRSSFGVNIRWKDVHQMIKMLADGGHIEAKGLLEDHAAMVKIRAIVNRDETDFEQGSKQSCEEIQG